MLIRVLAVGEKMPVWVDDACQDYLKRFPRDFSVRLQSVAAAGKRAGGDARVAREREGRALLEHTTARERVLALDVEGRQWSTTDLAREVESWRQDGRDVALFIGGPEGLDQACLSRAEQRWSLSKLTLPHPLVRIVLLEQLYRAWSILHSHPYHR